jgi:hypothetical protein
MTRSPYDSTPTFYPEPWENEAAYMGKDPDMWFSDNTYTIETAKTICAECPVRMLCLVKGRDETHGIFGGLTAKERKRLGEVA